MSEIKKGDAEGLLRRVRSVVGEWHERMEGDGEKPYSRRATLRDFTAAIHRLEDAAERFENGSPAAKRIPYKNVTIKRSASDTESEASHESFGLLHFQRVSGGARLFGSHLPHHQHYITMSVSRAKVCHNLSYDRYHPQGEIIEIALSAAQFAEAITSLNSGVGSPCTIKHIDHVVMEGVPDEAQAEHKKIRDGFEEDIEDVATSLEEARDRFAEILQGKSITKAKGKEMLSILAKAAQELRHNAPFVVNQFRESADRVVTAAKTEVEAYTMLVLQRAGMDAIASGNLPQLASDTKPVTKKLLGENTAPVELDSCPECETPYGDDPGCEKCGPTTFP